MRIDSGYSGTFSLGHTHLVQDAFKVAGPHLLSSHVDGSRLLGVMGRQAKLVVIPTRAALTKHKSGGGVVLYQWPQANVRHSRGSLQLAHTHRHTHRHTHTQTHHHHPKTTREV